MSVGKNTRLLLNVTHDFNSTRHVFNARLLSGSSGISGKTVKLKLNETEYEAKQTAGDGEATWTMSLSPQANNDATAFNVVASFEGDQSSVA